MSSVAKQLCDEIEEAVQYSIEDITSHQSHEGNRNKKRNPVASLHLHPQTVVIEKKKAINKIVPKKNAVINQFRSKEIITKTCQTVRDSKVNTIMSGPVMKCDTPCITKVRTRDRDKKQCKCTTSGCTSKETKSKNNEETQTSLFTLYNKASGGNIETNDEGTQYEVFESKDEIKNSKEDFSSLQHLMKTSRMNQELINNLINKGTQYLAFESKDEKNNSELDLSSLQNLRKISKLNKEFNNQLYTRLPEYINKLSRSYPDYINKINKSLEHSSHSKDVIQNADDLRQIPEKKYEKGACKLLCNQNDNKQAQNQEPNSSTIKGESLVNKNFMGAKKWAMSKYVTRGPDF